MSERRILVTSALPYANGPIHIGHLVEYLQTDIWVRFQKLRGHRCLYVCADDTHGTAIMISAKKAGVSEAEFIARVSDEHQRDFANFGIEFDNYGSTHSHQNLVLCHEFWQSIRVAGLVSELEIEQLYDPQAEMFLADRLVRGTCPRCAAIDQPGDNCSKCGTTYSPIDLVDPRSTLSGATPVVRKALHLFIELEKLRHFLEDWTQNSGALQTEVANYLKGHFFAAKDDAGKLLPLRDWDISRPAPYFGFEIPDFPGNFWYVWFDAPIGYIASTQQWCERHDEPLADWWKSADCEIHHFIGKDITYFHTLFWPGMLKTAGYSLPTKVHIHGFLTVDGEKMSKSKGTFVMARTYLDHLDPSYLRYFYATKLNGSVEDLDLAVDEFVNKVNTDLVGKVVNLASRCAKFLAGFQLYPRYDHTLDQDLFNSAASAGNEIAAAYEEGDYAKAMRLIMKLADDANRVVDELSPWKQMKEIGAKSVRDAIFGVDVQQDDDWDPLSYIKADENFQIAYVWWTCTIGLNLFRQIAIYLSPVLPQLAQQTGELLHDPIVNWSQASSPLVGTPVAKFQHMMKRIDTEKVNAMIEESKQDVDAAPEAADAQATDQWNDPGDSLAAEPLAAECTFDDFTKVDLRVARVIEAEQVPEARKLLKLKLSLGGGEYRQVFAGIKAAYDPEKLIGRQVVMVANLAPRQMKFGLSEGMVVACGPGGDEVYLLSPDEGAKVGQRVH
jgi:methionyl-tRNA synthetase